MVGHNPWNLVLRFILEVFVLVMVGLACWSNLEDSWRWVGVVAGPLLLILVWGLFNVPGDPSRGGGAPIPVSGRVRLAVEFGYFAVGVLATAVVTGLIWPPVVFALTVVLHYLLSLDRVGWLLTR